MFANIELNKENYSIIGFFRPFFLLKKSFKRAQRFWDNSRSGVGRGDT